MSERLTKALEFANYRLTLNNQLVSLRSKLQTKLIYSINGGTFTITRELITFVDSLIRQKNTTDIVLIDNFQNPIMIEDLEDFLENITSKYFEVTNDYHTEYVKLRQARKVHKLLDIEQDD
jgi:hypothetical protein